MIKRVLTWPDDNKQLRKLSTDVVEFNDELYHLINDLQDTLYSMSQAVGLAAPQIGVHKRVIIFHDPTRPSSRPKIMINPVVEKLGKRVAATEGCLSVPGMNERVTRHDEVRVTYLDIHGAKQEVQYSGYAATIVQHEVDHLNGVLYVDYLTKLKRDILKRKLLKL